jgi:hypothetical protein
MLRHIKIRWQDNQHNETSSIAALTGTFYCYAVCHYGDCRYAECCGAKGNNGTSIFFTEVPPLFGCHETDLATHQNDRMFVHGEQND